MNSSEPSKGGTNFKDNYTAFKFKNQTDIPKLTKPKTEVEPAEPQVDYNLIHENLVKKQKIYEKLGKYSYNPSEG
jgi:hypothetical protein